MPTFKFTSPEGKSYTVNGPDGATQEQAFAILQQQLGAAPATAQSLVDQIPGGGVAGNRNVGKPDNTPFLDKVTGAIEASRAVATGATTGLIGHIGGTLGGLAGSIATGEFGTEKGMRRMSEAAAEGASALTYQPKTAKGQEYVGNIADALHVSGVAGVPLPELQTLARASTPATQIAGNVTRAAAQQGGAKLSQLARAATPKMDPRSLELAQKAGEYDIPLRPDQLYNNRIMRMIGEASEKVPGSGSKAEVRQEAFNRAVIKQIGGDSEAAKLTPDVFDKAMRQSGQKIGDIAARTAVPIDEELSTALKSHLENAAKYETSDVGRVVTNYIDELKNKAQDGVIPGEAFRKLNTEINTKLRGTSNGDLKHALGSLQDDMQEALQRQLSGADLEALKQARMQYGIGKTIEPLVAKSATGDISAAALMGRVTANNAGKARMARGNGGEIGDLARIGQRFLKEPPSSGTAERGLAYGIAGGVAGGGVMMHPGATAGVYALSNLYNRAGPAISRKIVQSSSPSLSELAGGSK